MSGASRVPFDPELEPGLAGLPSFFTTLDAAGIADFRAALASPPSIGDVIAGRPVEVTDHQVPTWSRRRSTETVISAPSGASTG